MTDRLCRGVLLGALALIPTLGVMWILAVPDRFGFAFVSQQVVGVMLGLSVLAGFLAHPYRGKAGWLDLAPGLAGLAAWCWMAWNFEAWIVAMADRTPDMWGPGIVAVATMMEAVRKAAGRAIAILVWVLIVYAYFGDHLPEPFTAEVFPPTKTVLYLYADNNGIPGIVLRIVVELVLAFIVFGKLMEISGASTFFNDVATTWMGHRRGGPAKVAVVASAAFGTISGSTVANIMSTGVVTIPMMKRAGFRPSHAAAIEAVASNGGQIAPPVMGATAFIIAEFLEMPYAEVALAALIPAAFYFLVLFIQVDAVAVRFRVGGMPKGDLPRLLPTLIGGWPYLVPIALLIYVMFHLGYNPGLAGLYCAGTLLALYLVRVRRLPNRAEIRDFFIGGGRDLAPLLLIAGAAGAVIGILNATGLSFQLSLLLTTAGQQAGLFATLVLTALICIVLGMGMPTAAVYIVLVTVVAPALIEMGLVPISAHMFLFYFGLLSMLTPPVAVASMVAAQVAGSDMWRTGAIGVQFAITAYLLPFLWAYNPAILLVGSWAAVTLAVASCLAAALLLGQSALFLGTTYGKFIAAALFATAIGVGSATVWIGPENPLVLLPTVAGLALVWLVHGQRTRLPGPFQAARRPTG